MPTARLWEQIIWCGAAGVRGEHLLAECNYIPRLGEIHTPTLILVGRDDFVTPPSQAKIMHDGIPNSELVILEQSGHFPYVEEPEAFFAAVRDWLRRRT